MKKKKRRLAVEIFLKKSGAVSLAAGSATLGGHSMANGEALVGNLLELAMQSPISQAEGTGSVP